MPASVKLLLSVLVVGVAAATFLLQRDLGNLSPGYASLLVGLLMILGMWVFPEVKKEDHTTSGRPPDTPD
jgi:hypothetical protein